MSKPEYLEFRCCMCPNIEESLENCPSGPFKEEVTPCRFVKTYIDSRGWKYKVMSGIGENAYKGRYQKPGMTSWKCMNNLEWRETFDKAQSDLNSMAKLKGWEEL